MDDPTTEYNYRDFVQTQSDALPLVSVISNNFRGNKKNICLLVRSISYSDGLSGYSVAVTVNRCPALLPNMSGITAANA
jgi:hypothetical protein